MSGIDIDVEALNGIKSLRETLSVSKTAIYKSELGVDHSEDHIRRLEELIAQLDRYRPVNSHGKHGDRHTLFCGCDEVKKILERTPFQG